MVIPASPTATVTLAQGTGWWEMGRRFREGSSALELDNLLILLTVVIAVAISLWLLSRFFQQDRQHPYRGPRRLFWEVCRAHGLNLLDAWLLWQLAKAHKLAQPASLFLDATCFAAEKLPGKLKRSQHRLENLRDRLFS